MSFRRTLFRIFYRMEKKLSEELKRHFGFETFRPGQKDVISRILKGESSVAVFPTGAGKSLCYQLPALLLPHLTLVVSPLLSLMKDQIDFLHSHNIEAARLDSTLNRDEYNRIISRSRSGELKILMISVERFKNERFRMQLQNMKISLLVIDEAHCISEWGHNFRPEYLRLPDYKKEFHIEQTLLLTATATDDVASDIMEKFHIKEENLVRTGFYRENLFLRIVPVDSDGKRDLLIEDLRRASDQPTIVYVTLQKTAEGIAQFLKSRGIDAQPYHGGMKNENRQKIQNEFMSGSLNCVVATIAFGMGIDKRDIRKVIHFDLPKSIENYSQEIGRSGRDGKESQCLVYGDKSNVPVLENFVYGDTPEKNAVLQILRELKQSGDKWEVKLTGLSRESNIKQLPLKTLLVYLSVRKIIKPLYSYFEEYPFKFLIEPGEIISRFEGERKSFVSAIIENCQSKKVWTLIDVERVCSSYNCDRNRVISALEYFDEQQWIELTAKQAVEVYKVTDDDFNTESLAGELHELFRSKEEAEIKRIHKMVAFFESKTCLSRELAAYFGETLNEKNCGHCSICESGPVILVDANKEKNPDFSIHRSNLSQLKELISPHDSEENLTRYFCGISTPLFTRLKIKKELGFASLEKHSFGDVREWIRSEKC